MILAARTDQPEAYIALVNDDQKIEYEWQAGRQLSDTLLKKIDSLLSQNEMTKKDIAGLVVFKGPGSFTGLRISITTMNALADALNIPIVGSDGDDWLDTGVKRVKEGENEKIVTPNYGAEANITKPRK